MWIWTLSMVYWYHLKTTSYICGVKHIPIFVSINVELSQNVHFPFLDLKRDQYFVGNIQVDP